MHLRSARNEINACLDCGPDYRLTWKTGGIKNNLGSIIDTIRTKGLKVKYIIGSIIWPHMPTKFSIFLWKIKSRQTTTFTMLSAWDVQVHTLCPLSVLCVKKDELTSHLFFNCEYSRFVLLKVTEFLNHAIWKISNIPP